MKLSPLLALPFFAACVPQTIPADDSPSPFAEEARALSAEAPQAAVTLAAEAASVPPDLLAALIQVETGFASPAEDAGWLGFDAGQRAELEAEFGVLPAELASRDTNLLAGAHRLDRLRSEHAPSAGPEADARWWPAVVAWSGSTLHAAEVFAVLGAGQVAWTEDAAGVEGARDSEEDEALVTALPHPIALPDAHVDVELADLPEYDGAVGARLEPATARGGAAERIELRATGDSFAGSLGVEAHYVVNRRDGAVVQLRAESTGGPALAVALAAPRAFNAWTAPLLEGAGRLVVDLAARHGLALADVDTSDLGPSFPHDGWALMLTCLDSGGLGCAGVVGLPDYTPVLSPVDPGDDERDSLNANVAYFYQYANGLHPGASCQNTSIAMVLKTLGWSGTPDDITARYGKNRAQSPGGLASVFNELASEAGLSARLIPHTSGSVEAFRTLLNAGKPTIVHGYMTGYGHVVVATKYTGSHYVVNDPAGRWSQSWKGGYPYGYDASVGKGIRYSRSAFEQAVATSNGSSYLPMWFHELTGVDAGEIPVEEEPPAPPVEPNPPGSPPSTGATSSTGGVTVELLDPRHGAEAGDPMTVSARRAGGTYTEVTSDGWPLVEPTPSDFVNHLIDIWTHGERTVTARALSDWGTVLASHTVRVHVTDSPAPPPAGPEVEGCALQGAIACGETVAGDTSGADASDVLDLYTDTVGIWDAPELAWTFQGSGEVKVGFVDPRPMELNLDIMVLETTSGTCEPTQLMGIGWNSFTFEASAGRTYVFVVDGYNDEAGAFELYVDCG